MTTSDTVFDPATGLFTEAMVRALLPSRVATARRTLRQLGLVLVSVEDGPDAADLAEHVRSAIRDSDVAARFDDDTAALVLEFTPADGCVIVVDRLRRRITTDHPGATVRAGVACYPAHAVSAEELVEVARRALADAAEGTTGVAPIPD